MNDTNDENAPPAGGQSNTASPSPGVDDASTVWLVSFSDNDDRELRASQIAEALRLGEIDAETIVWREGAPDWLPIENVPELAKLLSSSGETATAPLVAPNAAMMRRAGAPAAPNTGLKPAVPSTKPTIAGRAVPAAKGSTKLGLPKFDPTKDRKPDATPLPKADTESPRPAPVAPKPAMLDMTPTRSKPAVPDMTPTQPRPAPPARAGAPIAVFGRPDDEEEAPISIEPVFMQPPSPAPARAMQRAKALSPGTLGVASPPATTGGAPSPGTPGGKKKPAPPPRPPEKRNAPPPEPAPDPGTPSIGTLAAPVREEAKPKPKPRAPVRTEPKPQPAVTAEGLLDAETLLQRAIALEASNPAPSPVAPAAIEVAPVVADEPVAPLLAPIDSVSTTPTESSASIAAPDGKEASDAPVSQARAAAPSKPAGKSPWPLLLAAAAVVLLAFLFMRGKQDADARQAESTPANTPAKAAEPAPPPAEPTPAVEPTAREPAAQEPAAPAMTAEVATPQQAPAETATVVATQPAKEKSGGAATAPTKPEPAAVTKESKPAEPKPAPAEEKPASAKPAVVEQKEVAVGGEFDKSAAAAALTGAAQEASGCRKEGDPSGVAVVHVTFSNAGKATRAVIEGPPFAGTQTGGCIAATLRRASVPPYGGDRVTVTKKVVIH